MGTSKTDVFTIRDNRIADYARAMGHPARVAILRLLLSRNSCICGDIVDELPLSQSTVSQHLKELKDVGLIRGEISGKKVCYCIDPQGWGYASKCMLEWFSVKVPNDCCG